MRLPNQSVGLNGRRLGKRTTLPLGIQPALLGGLLKLGAALLADTLVEEGGKAVGRRMWEQLDDLRGGRSIPF